VTLSTSPDAGCTTRVPSEVYTAWTQVAAKRTPASIFLTPEWTQVARATIGPITLSVGDPPYGIAALSRKADGTISFAGGEFTDEQDIVAAPGDCDRTARAVARWLAHENAPRILLEYVPGDTPTLDAFDEVLSGDGYRVTREKLVTSPRIALPGDFETYVQSLGKKERHELRRKLRRFESAPGTSFRWAKDDELPAVLDRFFALHRLSKGEKAAFMTDATERFFRDLAAALAAVSWLRLGVVRAYDQDAAVLFAFAYGDTLALYNAAYDPALGSLSLGIASHAFAVRDAIAHGFKVYDLLRGNEPYKYDLGAVDRWLWRLDAVRI
jgi:CelD/BcsL family acetyltransferase involved in cellulose biosynthesis